MNSVARINKFFEYLTGNADLAFFPLSADLQYLTGIHREIPNYGAVMHPGAWVEGLWLAQGKKPILALTRMTADFNNPGIGDAEVRVLGDWDDPLVMLRQILKDLDSDNTTKIAVGERCHAETLIHIQMVVHQMVFISATELLRSMRTIKSDQEITMMRRAGEITEAAFGDVLKSLKFGMTELEVVSEIDYQLRSHGSLGSSFNTTLYAVGPQHELVFGNTERTWPRELHPPVALLFDFGAIYQGYCYDFGRTVSFGVPTPDMQVAFDLVMASQAAGINAMKAAQVTAEQVDQTARQVIESAGMGEAFRHRLGHGIGLDVHEPPFLTQGDDNELQAGMLFTVEPSVLVPFAGSARVEDVVLVSDKGGIPLTKGYQTLTFIE